jgi:hypothetical protein
MQERALDAGTRAAWVMADSVYEEARGLLGVWLDKREQPYVLALSGKAHVWAGFSEPRVSEVLDALREGELRPEEAGEGWERLSAGDGSKGPRPYDWARLPLNPPMQEGFHRWLLVRRSVGDPDDLTAYRSSSPRGRRSGSWRASPAAAGR